MNRFFLLTPSAGRDINAILTYVMENSGPVRAEDVRGKLLDGFRKISAQPNLVGHVRDDLADESLRVHVVFSYLVIYRLDTDPVQIIRVIHGARDLTKALEEDA